MELDYDLKAQFEGLEKQIKKYKNWAIILAIMAFSPFLVALIFNFLVFERFLTFEELGTYIGGISAPFGSISGILFVYVAFLGQRQQLLFNQQEIRVNRKALEDSLREQTEQRKAIEAQNMQFQIQSFETTFFNLLTHFRNSGPLDRISKIYYSLNNIFVSLTKGGKQDNTGQWITYTKKNAKKILETKSYFIESVMKLGDSDVTDINDTLNMLISILEHISNHDGIQTNYQSTLQNNLSRKEKFVLFYFYLATSDQYQSKEQKLLFKFFNEMDRMSFFFDHHELWVNDLPK